MGLYALCGGDYVRRGAVYAAGAALGVLPLVLYNRWAFGSITHLSYRDVVIWQGQSGHDVTGAHSQGFFGVVAPSLRVGLELLFSAKGLLVLAPVVAFGAVGTVLLYRRERRPEALAIAAVAVAYVLYNAGFHTAFGGPFGGDSPGPRFLITILPFLAVPLGLAFRRYPLPAGGLAAASRMPSSQDSEPRPRRRWASAR